MKAKTALAAAATTSLGLVIALAWYCCSCPVAFEHYTASPSRVKLQQGKVLETSPQSLEVDFTQMKFQLH